MNPGDHRYSNYRDWGKAMCLYCGSPLPRGRDFCSRRCEEEFFGPGR